MEIFFIRIQSSQKKYYRPWMDRGGVKKEIFTCVAGTETSGRFSCISGNAALPALPKMHATLTVISLEHTRSRFRVGVLESEYERGMTESVSLWRK